MKFLVTLTDSQANALDELMSDDLAENRTAYIVALIADRYRERQAEKNKRPVGRPRKVDTPSGDEYEQEPDYSTDLPKSIVWMGEKIGPLEYKAKMEMQNIINERAGL